MLCVHFPSLLIAVTLRHDPRWRSRPSTVLSAREINQHLFLIKLHSFHFSIHLFVTNLQNYSSHSISMNHTFLGAHISGDSEQQQSLWTSSRDKLELRRQIYATFSALLNHQLNISPQFDSDEASKHSSSRLRVGICREWQALLVVFCCSHPSCVVCLNNGFRDEGVSPK